MELSSPQVGASVCGIVQSSSGSKSPRLHGEQSPLFWDQFNKHSLGYVLWARQVMGHTTAPKPLNIGSCTECCSVLVGFYVCATACWSVQPSSGSKSPKASWWAEPITLGKMHWTFTGIDIIWKSIYWQHLSPRTIIYWYCTECCFVFVGFYVATTACWSVQSSSGSIVAQASWWAEPIILGMIH